MTDDPIAGLAVGLNEDSKASRRKAAAKPMTEALAESREHLEGKGELGEAVASLGDAIADRDGPFDPDGSGDGGAHHAAHERSIADMEAAVENFEPDTDQLVFDGRDLFLTLLKQQNEIWRSKSRGEQSDIAGQIEGAVRSLIEKTVELTRAGGQPAIRALLESYGEKDGLKASLKIKPFDDAEAKAAVLGLHGAVGKHVLVIVASAEDFAQGARPAEVEGNEPALDFEAGNDRGD